eukprot:CAMPEP_0174741428 /NCGR_PEP_ID=MMETSP1094-20130205/76308_1 /TAXON_ID=156173 /ORGANISM="Chrysochromulina brevifilum, Strain UTEX LB 985" /LENGTH=205 /DNA_ID=CAMNT_0015945313 /DNA_START=1 /DNA_END=615 /DNA_ORIENTATION=-
MHVPAGVRANATTKSSSRETSSTASPTLVARSPPPSHSPPPSPPVVASAWVPSVINAGPTALPGGTVHSQMAETMLLLAHQPQKAGLSATPQPSPEHKAVPLAPQACSGPVVPLLLHQVAGCVVQGAGCTPKQLGTSQGLVLPPAATPSSFQVAAMPPVPSTPMWNNEKMDVVEDVKVYCHPHPPPHQPQQQGQQHDRQPQHDRP